MIKVDARKINMLRREILMSKRIIFPIFVLLLQMIFRVMILLYSQVMVIPTRNWRYSLRLQWNYTVTYAKSPTSQSAWPTRWISTWKCSTSKPFFSVTCTAAPASQTCSVMPKPHPGIIGIARKACVLKDERCANLSMDAMLESTHDRLQYL